MDCAALLISTVQWTVVPRLTGCLCSALLAALDAAPAGAEGVPIASGIGTGENQRLAVEALGPRPYSAISVLENCLELYAPGALSRTSAFQVAVANSTNPSFCSFCCYLLDFEMLPYRLLSSSSGDGFKVCKAAASSLAMALDAPFSSPSARKQMECSSTQNRVESRFAYLARTSMTQMLAVSACKVCKAVRRLKLLQLSTCSRGLSRGRGATL